MSTPDGSVHPVIVNFGRSCAVLVNACVLYGAALGERRNTTNDANAVVSALHALLKTAIGRDPTEAELECMWQGTDFGGM